MSELAAATARDAGRRIVAVDVVRGVAILAMVAYHFSFDLFHFGFVDWPVTTAPAWRGFAAAIAASFLFLVGVGLVLAHGEHIQWRPFGRRLAIIIAAAALVTVSTFLAMPGAPVLFGILHAIALFSVLGLAFLQLPRAVVAALAVLMIVLPFVWRSATFDGIGFVWLGLAERVRPTMDYEPLFPWFGVTLLGIAFARTFRNTLARAAEPAGNLPPRTVPVRALSWAGRRSLIIYLVHQPLLFALLTTFVALAGPPTGAWSRDFVAGCEASCRDAPGTVSACVAVCRCARDEIIARGLVPAPAVIAGSAQRGPSQAELTEIATACRQRHAE